MKIKTRNPELHQKLMVLAINSSQIIVFNWIFTYFPFLLSTFWWFKLSNLTSYIDVLLSRMRQQKFPQNSKWKKKKCPRCLFNEIVQQRCEPFSRHIQLNHSMKWFRKLFSHSKLNYFINEWIFPFWFGSRRETS